MKTDTERFLDLDSKTQEFILTSRRSIVAQGLTYLGASALSDVVAMCCTTLKELTGVVMSVHQMTTFLDMHSVLKGDIWTNGVDDTCTKENFIDCLSQFLCGCDWTNSDDLSKLMQRQINGIHWSQAGSFVRDIYRDRN